MATVDETQVFDDEQIRDTATHNSAVAETGEFQAETILVYNGLDQSCTFQLQGSRDQTTWLNVGGTFAVGSTTNAYQTVSDYFPAYRLTAVCGSSPTTNAVDAWILKSGAVN